MADDDKPGVPAPSLNAAINAKLNASATDSGTPSIVKDYDPTENQDKVRSNIAYWLVASLLFVIAIYCLVGLLGGGACLLPGAATAGTAASPGGACTTVSASLAVTREFLGTALASITGLVGAVTGFYFGAQTAKQSR